MSKGCEGQFFHFISLFYRSVKKIKKWSNKIMKIRNGKSDFKIQNIVRRRKLYIEVLKNQIVKIFNDK